MIVSPDFPEHWKTLRLVEITGDESAPMAVLRLWAHCQHSRRSVFPEMTPAQLSTICRWGKRKPACHIALMKSGFVDKWSPKGFAAHQWNEHNSQLLQKWQAGQKGGRPPASEFPAKNGASGKTDRLPTDNRPLTGTKPDRVDRVDQRDEIDRASRLVGSVARNFKVDSENTRPDSREDWQSLTVTQKAQRLLEPSEFMLDDQRWQKRSEHHPQRLESILDKMHADISEGTVIKKRGAYAEELWKVTP